VTHIRILSLQLFYFANLWCAWLSATPNSPISPSKEPPIFHQKWPKSSSFSPCNPLTLTACGVRDFSTQKSPISPSKEPYIIIIRALHSIKSDPHSHHPRLATRWLWQPVLCMTSAPKRALYHHQKSPEFHQKSPEFHQNWPKFSSFSPWTHWLLQLVVCVTSAPKRAIHHHQKSPMFYQKWPKFHHLRLATLCLWLSVVRVTSAPKKALHLHQRALNSIKRDLNSHHLRLTTPCLCLSVVCVTSALKRALYLHQKNPL